MSNDLERMHKIKARCGAATRGPWEVTGCCGSIHLHNRTGAHAAKQTGAFARFSGAQNLIE